MSDIKDLKVSYLNRNEQFENDVVNILSENTNLSKSKIKTLSSLIRIRHVESDSELIDIITKIFRS